MRDPTPTKIKKNNKDVIKITEHKKLKPVIELKEETCLKKERKDKDLKPSIQNFKDTTKKLQKKKDIIDITEQVMKHEKLKPVIELNEKRCFKMGGKDTDLKPSVKNLRDPTKILPKNKDFTEIAEQVMTPEKLKHVLELNVKSCLEKEKQMFETLAE